MFVLGITSVHAQVSAAQYPFMDKNGVPYMETRELQQDSIRVVAHRRDDIVWSRIVYSVIDMRFKQNYPLYFPTNYNNAKFKSFFGLMLTGITEDGVPVYSKPLNSTDGLIPNFGDSTMLIPKSGLSAVTELKEEDGGADDGFDLGAMAAAEEDDMDAGMDDGMEEEQIDYAALTGAHSVLEYDSIRDELRVSEYYDLFVPNQVKFLLQEIIFFDKHYSRLYREIIAIAPLYSPQGTSDDPYESLYGEILFWVPFQLLRNTMAHQYMIQSRNSTKRVTFEEFFEKRLYTSYIIGEENMYDRVIPIYAKTEEEIKKEQERLQTELLTFEQDLWEY